MLRKEVSTAENIGTNQRRVSAVKKMYLNASLRMRAERGPLTALDWTMIVSLVAIAAS